MPDFGRMAAETRSTTDARSRIAAKSADVHGPIGSGSDFVQTQVDGRFVILNERRIRNRAIRVGGVLIMSKDLGRAKVGGIPGELVDPAEPGIGGAKGATVRIVVISNRQVRLSIRRR